MQIDFIAKVCVEFEREGYLTELDPNIPGVLALLYTRSPRRFRLGAAKVEDHFLFVDWGNAAFGRLDRLLEIHRRFSSFANLGFKTPHPLRLQIPNLAVAAVSPDAFPEDVVRFARGTHLNPWYGGETGQIVLVDTVQDQVISFRAQPFRRSPVPGAFPLNHAAEVIRSVCQRVFQTGE